jgi:hypothetical protein
MECCWGPPRGPVADGPMPDLLDREWIPVLVVTLLLGVTGLAQLLGIGCHPHGDGLASEWREAYPMAITRLESGG